MQPVMISQNIDKPVQWQKMGPALVCKMTCVNSNGMNDSTFDPYGNGNKQITFTMIRQEGSPPKMSIQVRSSKSTNKGS